jgi:tRNA C32,U32 (ribose-2'-O)-methylase TrmJ
MNARTQKVLDEAMALSPDERGELAKQLFESLRAVSTPEVELAWSDVIATRARAVLDGTAPTSDLDDALRDIETRVRATAR